MLVYRSAMNDKVLDEVLRVGTDELTIRVPSAATGGEILVIDVRLPAGGGPPVLHRHAPTEIYRVDAGELAVYVERADGAVERIAATAGDVVPIPAGRAHTVRNESPGEVRAHVTFAPGAPMERFVRDAAGLAEAGPPSVEDVMAVAARHGVEMAGPIPAR
jgi:oxalate decarboxylase/phosphoglucose isomerase-like protein (cupin superfamily)